MSRARLERRLNEVTERIRKAKSDLAVADEQLAHFMEATDEARLRALVSETPVAEHEHRDAAKHSDAMARHREELVGMIARLEKEQDDLLDQYLAEKD